MYINSHYPSGIASFFVNSLNLIRESYISVSTISPDHFHHGSRPKLGTNRADGGGSGGGGNGGGGARSGGFHYKYKLSQGGAQHTHNIESCFSFKAMTHFSTGHAMRPS